MAGDDFDARELELEQKAAAHRDYSRHALAFAGGMGSVVVGVLTSGLSEKLLALGFCAAAAAWGYSGLVAWRSGIHMFGGAHPGGFGQFVVTTRSTTGARIVAAGLFVLALACVGAAVGALR